MKVEAKERILKLRKLIDKYRYDYHVLNKLEISESALDSLKRELKKMEDEFPELITPDSPTQRVAGKPLKEFKKIRHSFPMFSLEDVFSEEEFTEWVARIKKLFPAEAPPADWRAGSAKAGVPEFYSELKFDGLALSLVYENGNLIYAATRGDGKVGEDVTQNVRTMESVPLSIAEKKRVEIRGEAIITNKNFNAINKEQKKKELKEYANARNLAAGSLRQLDSKITASRKLDFFSYDILGQDFENHAGKHETLAELGFKTGGANERLCKNLEEVFKHHKKIAEMREKIPYTIDGLVVSVNSNELFRRLGVVGKTPRGAIAYKFAARESSTIVENIIVQVGRTGALTPVAVLRPVQIGGVTISRATLHNEDEIKRLGLKIGDSVIVGRAGDVIPDIIKVLPELRTGKEKNFHMPKVCPVCGKPVKKMPEGGVGVYCLNQKCPARHREWMYHFVSRKAFNIDGLGPKILNAFLDFGLIRDIPDIFELKEGDIAPLERFGERSAGNIIKSINNAKKITLARFIYALGILHVGEETAIDLADHFGSLEKIESAGFDELNNIPNTGEVAAKSVFDWFRDEPHKNLVKKLLRYVEIENPKKRAPGKLAGKTFVLTGELESLNRDEAKARVRELGGDPSETVSKNTDYVVVGANPGSKYDKAQKLGVKILDEKEFLKMVK